MELLSVKVEKKLDTASKIGLGIIAAIAIASAVYHVPQREAEHRKLEHVEKKEIPALKHALATEHTLRTRAEDDQAQIAHVLEEGETTQLADDPPSPPIPQPKPKPSR